MVTSRTAALAALVTALCLANPASAGAPKKFPVDISIRVDPNPRAAQARGTVPYVGKLRSPKRACERNRIVTLWRITEGSDIKQSQGTFETGSDGKWAIDSQVNPDGEYFATTPKITLPNSGKICKRGRSESIIRDNTMRRAPTKFKSDVTLKVDMSPRAQAPARGTFRWHGGVKSENRKCKNKRLVILWTEPEGGGPRINRGEALTGPDGKWSLLVDLNTEGEWYAVAKRRTLGNGNICKSARSESIIRDLG